MRSEAPQWMLGISAAGPLDGRAVDGGKPTAKDLPVRHGQPEPRL